MPIEVIILFTSTVINTLLSIFIFRSQRDQVGLTYSIFALFIALWSLGLAFFLLETDLDKALLFANGYYVAAAGIPMLFLYFSLIFPERRPPSDIVKTFIFGPVILFIAILLANKYFLIEKILIVAWGKNVLLNPLHYLFYGGYFILFVLLAYYHLGKSYLSAQDVEGRVRLKFIIIGTLISYALGMVFNLFFPWIGNYQYIWLGPLFTLIMVVSIGYAVTKHHLFNIKVIATELTTFGLWIFILIRTLISDTLQEQIINGSLLIIVVLFGILLIRGVIKEVRTRERMENLAEELATANARLRVLDQQKTEFVSIASHQLRSPLTAIKGYSSMLLEGSFGELSEKTREAVDRIFQSSQRLVLIVEDFLNVSRIEQGRMKYDFSTFDFRELSSRIVEEQRPTAEKKGLKLSFSAEKLKNYTLMADPGKVSQVVANFIDNAIKYTPAGSIAAKLSRDNEKILLAISDTGVGISAETMPKLFDKFSRALDASKTNTGGTGLGLYVAKEIMKAHKGCVWAESPGEGKGSTFFIEFSGDSVK